MILPDINLLIHAHNNDSPRHAAARRWWDRTLAIERGYTLHSTDTDFARFPGLKWTNPLQ
jgi:predicted nucleic acid-binding protein